MKKEVNSTKNLDECEVLKEWIGTDEDGSQMTADLDALVYVLPQLVVVKSTLCDSDNKVIDETVSAISFVINSLRDIKREIYNKEDKY